MSMSLAEATGQEFHLPGIYSLPVTATDFLYQRHDNSLCSSQLSTLEPFLHGFPDP